MQHLMEYSERPYEAGLAQAASEPADTPRVPGIGDDVLYVLESGRSEGQVRPAKVVRGPWNNALPLRVNLQVLIDGSNDFSSAQGSDADGTRWRTSIPYSATHEPGTWHWR